jgi:CHAD domain-containing protein
VDLINVFLGRGRVEKARRILKRHLDAFDPLRDTQVQLQVLQVLAKQGRRFPETELLQRSLTRREARCLERAARRMERVKLRSLQKVVRKLERQLAHVRHSASRRARHRTAVMKTVREAFGKTLELQRAMDPGSAGTIHRTRLAFKKFRYMVEALQPLFPEISSARLAAMQRFQSMLGKVQDTEMFLARLGQYTRGHEQRAKMLARFRRWLTAQHTAQIGYCLKHADGLRAFWPLPDKTGGKPTSLKRNRQASLLR